MTALVALVAIMAAQEVRLTLVVDGDFINGKEAKAGACEFCYGLLRRGASLGKAVFAQLLLLHSLTCLLLFLIFL